MRTISKLIKDGQEYIFKEYEEAITTPGIYHNSDLGLISLSSDGESWITIADKNLGASVVYNDGDVLSESNCGGYFQWGNNYMFPFDGNVTTDTTQVDTTGYGPGNYYTGSTFIIKGSDRTDYNWSSVDNKDLWGDTTDTLEARQGPCDNGFYIPPKPDIQTLKSTLTSLGIDTSNGDCLKIYLKMPYAGYRDYLSSQGTVYDKNRFGRYWLSNPNTYSTDGAYYIDASSFSFDIDSWNRPYGFPIRPFKNEPVVPTTDWNQLYTIS